MFSFIDVKYQNPMQTIPHSSKICLQVGCKYDPIVRYLF